MRSLKLYLLVKQRNDRQASTRRSVERRLERGAFGLGAVLALLLVVGILAASWAYAGLTAGLPSVEALPEMLDLLKGTLLQPTRIYDRTGQTLLLNLENPGIPRRSISIDPSQPEHISPWMVQFTTAYFDPNFWKHTGFSGPDLTLNEPYTLAERLVSELLLSNETAGPRRALRMRLLAAQVVARYGRTQVLEWYLNSANFGHLAYGVESAARLYFDKPAADLSLAEAALLTGVLETPALNPLDSPAAARDRQKEVLEKLAAAGTITAELAAQTVASELTFRTDLPVENAPAAAFTRLVVDQLSERFGRDRLERGGLRVTTTLDLDLQHELACAVRTQLAHLEGSEQPFKLPDGQGCDAARLLPTLQNSSQPLPPETAASAVVSDPTTGQVLGLLGETTLAGESSRFGAHEPGSMLTPFVAVAGFARGLSPASLVWDIPSSLPEDLAGHRNPDGLYHGPLRLRTALANDYLTPSAQLLEQFGALNVWRQAEALGLRSLEKAGNSAELLFSGGEATLLEMAQAYGTIANQGVQAGVRLSENAPIDLTLVLKVEDAGGRVWLDQTQPQTQSVLSDSLAYLIHNVLSDDVARWPSLGYPNPLEIGRPAGAKSGLSDDGRQVWTAGYTPQRAAVVWMGLPADSEARLQVKQAAGVWYAAAQYAVRALPVQDWAEPAGLSRMDVCDPSGLRPTTLCPNVVSELFLSGNEPVTYDPLYRSFDLNRETGKLATVFTPPQLIEQHTFMVVPQDALSWAQSAEIEQPPSGYDTIQAAQILPDVHFSSPALFSFVSGQVNLSGTAAGTDFASYTLQIGQGINPQNWQEIGSGSQAVQAGVLGAWDTRSGPDGLFAVRLAVLRSDQHIETAVLQVTVDNTPPLVRVPYPLTAQQVQSRAGEITLQADAQDAVGIARVEWWVDGRQVGERPSLPYSLLWTAQTGVHTLVVRAYDLAGNLGESQPVSFTVANP